MATIRKQIIDAFVTAIDGIAGINKVTTDITIYSGDDAGDYPKVLVTASKPEVEIFAYDHPTADDREARMEVSISGIVHNINSANIRGDLDAIMEDIEQAVETSSTLAGLTTECHLLSDEIDEDLDQNYGIFSAVYFVEYLYNHNTP